MSACPGVPFYPSPSVPINGCLNLASCTNLLYTINVLIVRYIVYHVLVNLYPVNR